MTKRVFIALLPDAVVREKFTALQQQLGREKLLGKAKAVDCNNLHMTLHFIGAISIEKLRALEVSLDSVRCKAFNFDVNTVGCFPKPGVFWLGMKNIPPELEELERQTATCVQQCIEGYQPIPYRPHITLFRKARLSLDKEILPEINWQVKSFALMESKSSSDGVQYHMLKEWRLS
ncbi:MAG: RNA 2',3'-cyclic phosphodiesterase [Gammaproteobacteria bacterium]|nr:RNA 2',3'-cyclic phosphodiesterase [Gammaproteobacteria bacterium]